MNSIIKKTMIIISVIIVIGVFASLIFVKSDYYLNKQAMAKRVVKLNELNSIKRHYIYEGVYIYRSTKNNLKVSVDKFKNNKIEFEDNGFIDLEVSFTSKKLVIINNDQSIKEEIYFKTKYEISSIDEKRCAYRFFVDKWHLIDMKNNELIQDISASNECDKNLILFVEEGKTPWFNSYYGFRSTTYDRKFAKIKNLFSKGSGDGDPNLWLQNVKYTYTEALTPEYVASAKYEDYIYQLDTYKEK